MLVGRSQKFVGRRGRERQAGRTPSLVADGQKPMTQIDNGFDQG